jgi:hypothetical protein
MSGYAYLVNHVRYILFQISCPVRRQKTVCFLRDLLFRPRGNSYHNLELLVGIDQVIQKFVDLFLIP